jgi:Tfp pilus assembly protein PilF
LSCVSFLLCLLFPLFLTARLSVVAAHPDASSAHYDLGIAYKQSDDLPHVSAELERALQLDPSIVEAHYTLAATYVDMGQPDKAIQHLRTAVRHRPDYTDAWFELDTVLKQQGDAAGAIDARRHAVALDPNPYGFGAVVLECGSLRPPSERSHAEGLRGGLASARRLG